MVPRPRAPFSLYGFMGLLCLFAVGVSAAAQDASMECREEAKDLSGPWGTLQVAGRFCWNGSRVAQGGTQSRLDVAPGWAVSADNGGWDEHLEDVYHFHREVELCQEGPPGQCASLDAHFAGFADGGADLQVWRR